jgi:hypothetical protein
LLNDRDTIGAIDGDFGNVLLGRRRESTSRTSTGGWRDIRTLTSDHGAISGREL